MIVLTAYATFRPDKIEEALDACSIVRGHSVLEPGCEVYDYYQSPEEPHRIVFVEEWTSKAHLDTHFEQDAFKTFAATIANLLDGAPEIKIFESTRVA